MFSYTGVLSMKTLKWFTALFGSATSTVSSSLMLSVQSLGCHWPSNMLPKDCHPLVVSSHHVTLPSSHGWAELHPLLPQPHLVCTLNLTWVSCRLVVEEGGASFSYANLQMLVVFRVPVTFDLLGCRSQVNCYHRMVRLFLSSWTFFCLCYSGNHSLHDHEPSHLLIQSYSLTCIFALLIFSFKYCCGFIHQGTPTSCPCRPFPLPLVGSCLVTRLLIVFNFLFLLIASAQCQWLFWVYYNNIMA